MDRLNVTWWDRFLISVAPSYGTRRVRARAQTQLMVRNYDAAQIGRRTAGWKRTRTDANGANGPALATLRDLSRDLRRNNGWARRGIEVITNNTVGWGIVPTPGTKPSRARAMKALATWKEWADSASCDFDGKLNLYGIQRLVMSTVVESGECLVIKQPPAPGDYLAIPIRLQVLEPDYLDASRTGRSADGGRTIQGIEFDRYGRRVAYWLYTSHPGAKLVAHSERVPADRVLHIYDVDRPGQARGVPWLASAIVKLNDFDDFEDAELMQQKVAACFGAFVSDMDPAGTAIGEQSTDDARLESLEPGHIQYLKPGQSISFAQPPAPRDGAFSTRALRRIATSIGVTYEDLTGDYSQVNYSSARMARLAHWQNVNDWRWQMLIPQLCEPVWAWAMTLAQAIHGWPEMPRARWAAPPMPMIDPDREGLASQRLVRSGTQTLFDIIRERGEDPIEHLDEIQAVNEELDKRGIVLDCDPRRTTSGGQMQSSGSGTTDDDVEDLTDEATEDADSAETSH